MLIEKLLQTEVGDFVVQEKSENKFVLIPDREDQEARKYNEEILEGSKIIVEVFGKKKDGLENLAKKYIKDNLDSKPVGSVCVDADSDKDEGYELYALKTNIEEKLSIYHFVKSGYTKEISYVAYAKIIKEYSTGISIPISELLTWPIVIRDNICPPDQDA